MVCSCPAKARPGSRTCLRQLLCGVAKDACRRRCLMPPCRLSLLSGGRPPAKCFYTRLFSAFLHLKHTCAVAACLSRTYFFRSFKRATPEAIFSFMPGVLKRRRNASGLSQQQLAGSVDVSKDFIFAFEGGRSVPNLDMLVLRTEALGVRPGELVNEMAAAAEKEMRWQPRSTHAPARESSARLFRASRIPSFPNPLPSEISYF